tara:strand:- start:1844 stop:1972 length:129 start_codon:yes stop_codon:yes gene_type:complete
MAEKSKEFMDKGDGIYLSESGEVREPIDLNKSEKCNLSSVFS